MNENQIKILLKKAQVNTASVSDLEQIIDLLNGENKDYWVAFIETILTEKEDPKRQALIEKDIEKMANSILKKHK